LYLGWNAWDGRPGGSTKKVTYWRGQRIELSNDRPPQAPSWQSLAPVLVYLLLGTALFLGGLVVMLQHI
ncbi:MAG: hypothetical protein HC837_13590, partial [Chloroflexaceae bacterium]|nr:hypothetical protein [Chloroflexaceae bacterium]